MVDWHEVSVRLATCVSKCTPELGSPDEVLRLFVKVVEHNEAEHRLDFAAMRKASAARQNGRGSRQQDP